MTTIINTTSSGTPTILCEKTRSPITGCIVRIVIVIITLLAAIGSITASVVSGILPLLSICGLSLLLLSILAMKSSPPPLIKSKKVDRPYIPNELAFLLMTNETVPHTKILENCSDLVTDNWTKLPNILEDSSTAFLQKVWKFNNSQTVLFSTTGSLYTPRVQCCCDLMITLEYNEITLADLDMLNIQYAPVENLSEGQFTSFPWKNHDGSTNKHRLGLPQFLGFIQSPQPPAHKNNPIIAYSLAKSSYVRCIQEAVAMGVDMIQLPLISTSLLQTSKNPQEALAWKSAIQTALVSAVAQFATTHPTTNMNIIVVSPPGLGPPL